MAALRGSADAGAEDHRIGRRVFDERGLQPGRGGAAQVRSAASPNHRRRLGPVCAAGDDARQRNEGQDRFHRGHLKASPQQLAQRGEPRVRFAGADETAARSCSGCVSSRSAIRAASARGSPRQGDAQVASTAPSSKRCAGDQPQPLAGAVEDAAGQRFDAAVPARHQRHRVRSQRLATACAIAGSRRCRCRSGGVEATPEHARKAIALAGDRQCPSSCGRRGRQSGTQVALLTCGAATVVARHARSSGSMSRSRACAAPLAR